MQNAETLDLLYKAVFWSNMHANGGISLLARIVDKNGDRVSELQNHFAMYSI